MLLEAFRLFLFARLSTDKIYIYFLVTFAIFMASHGAYMISPSHNFQDWLTIAGVNHYGLSEGRVFAYLSRKLQSDVNIIGLQLMFSYSVLSILPFFLLQPDQTKLSNAVFIFGVGTTYPLFVDVLGLDGWSATAFLALLFGFTGFSFAVIDLKIRRFFRLAIGIFFVVCGTMTYQTYTFLGVLVPCIALISASKRSISSSIRLILDTAIILIISVVLFVVLLTFTFFIFDIEPNEKLSQSGFRFLINKKMFYMYGASVWPHLNGIRPAFEHLKPVYYSYLQLIVFLSIPILFVVSAKKYYENKDIRIVFVVIGLIGAMFVAPFNIALLFDIYLPPRARAGFDFAMAASFIAILYAAVKYLPQTSGLKIGKHISKIIVFLTIVFVLSGTVASGYLWNFSKVIHRKDAAKALSIHANFVEVTRTEKLQSNKLILVGSDDTGEWFYSLKSAFKKPWSAEAIMESMYDLDVEYLRHYEFKGSCNAFPSANSVFVKNKIVHVCLQDINWN